MKKNLTLLLLLIITTHLLQAQIPQAFSYHATARETTPPYSLITNQLVGFKFILTAGSSGSVLYTETHDNILTNDFGTVTLEIGRGVSSNDFSSLDWSQGDIFIHVEMDENNIGNYLAIGESELLSVPYALYASNSGNGLAVSKEFGINVTDERFGGDIDGDWSQAFQRAIDTLTLGSGNERESGGIIYVPRGEYILNSGIEINSDQQWNLSSITIQGEGMYSTIINFNNEGTGLNIKDGIFVKLRDFRIQKANGNNVHFSSDGQSHIEISNVTSDGASNSGFVFENVIMTTLTDAFAGHNGGNGFEFNGYSTSITSNSCFAASNGQNGWLINDMSYSTFNGCGADLNQRAGWQLSNITAVKLIGCGSESNQQAGFYVRTDMPTGTLNEVNSLSMESCFGYKNNLGNPLGFSNFLYVKSNNGNTANVHVSNCSDLDPLDLNNYSMVANGSGVKIISDFNSFEKSTVKVNGAVILYSRYYTTPN